MYVIAAPAGAKRPSLYRVRREGGKMIGTVPDHEMYTSPTPVEIKSDDIVVSLGDDPAVGTVYGVLVEPIRGRMQAAGYGELYNFVPKMGDAVKERVTKAFRASAGCMKTMGIPLTWETRTEIRNPRGNVLGTYRYSSKGVDVLTLRPQSGQSSREMVKVIVHELFHGVWHRHMDATQRSRWIKLYDRYVQVSTVPVRDIQRMLRDMAQIGGLRPYLKDAEPEQQAAANMYVGWLSKVHSIGARELNDLVTSGEEAPIPDTHIHRADVQTAITLYGRTNAAELFCEAGGSHAVGDLSDKRLIRMIGELRA